MRRRILFGLLVFAVFVGGAATSAAAIYWMWPTAQVRVARAARARTDEPMARAAERGRASPRPGTAPRPRTGGPTARSLTDRSAAAARDNFLDLSPEERLVYRQTYRDERLSDLDARLDAYARQAGWDPELTEEVRTLLIETTDGISAVFERIDRGEAVWEDERDEVRDFRLAQAAKVEALLGDGFLDFVEGMQFTRFLGDTTARDETNP